MRIKDLLENQGQFFSLEFFPPKERDQWPAFFKVVEDFKPLDPLFVSVTYGAGGSTQANTLDIVTRLKNEMDLEPMAHLTCVGADEKAIHGFLQSLTDAGIDNVLALRGDPPKGSDTFVPDNETFRYASDLARFIRQEFPEMGVGVAGYPEVHPEAKSADEDMRFLKFKIDQGGDIVVTQLFFDNDIYFDFVSRARAHGIDAPIIPGVLPVLNLGGLKRMLSLCGAYIDPDYLAALEKADSEGGAPAVAKLGIEFARKQVHDLLHRGAPGVHLYTLNKAEACLQIVSDCDICRKLNTCGENGEG